MTGTNFCNKKTITVLFSLQTSLEVVHDITQPAFACSKLTIGTLEQDVKCVQS